MLRAMPLSVQVIEVGAGGRLLRLGGDLDVVGAELAWRRADALLTGGALLLIDVSRLEMADSSGLRFLLLARREAVARGGVLRLVGVRPWLRERLRLGGVLELFDIRPDVTAALHGVSS